MSEWVRFDDVIDSTAERQTREDDARRAVYKFDESYRCPKCDETFPTRADRDDHMRRSYSPANLPRWMDQ